MLGITWLHIENMELQELHAETLGLNIKDNCILITEGKHVVYSVEFRLYTICVTSMTNNNFFL